MGALFVLASVVMLFEEFLAGLLVICFGYVIFEISGDRSFCWNSRGDDSE